MCPGFRPEEWLKCSAYPLGGVKFRGHAWYPVFPPDTLIYVPISSEVLGGGVFLYPLVHNLPQLHMHAVIDSPLQFLCILLLEETFVQV